MTNETTASQPKSIGDDAQFQLLLADYVHKDMARRDFDREGKAQAAFEVAEKSLLSFIDSRAPAAQASATIQAAPDLSKLPVHYVEGLENGGYYLCTDVIRALAAAIQEPVMVAEPVAQSRRVGVPDSMIQWAVHNVLDALEFGRDWNREAFDVLRTAFQHAAPMVADPAGVVLYQAAKVFYNATVADPAVRISTTIEAKRNLASDSADKLRAALGAFKDSGAATVKAVPSEALDEAAAYRMWRECEISEDSWFMQHLADYLPAECRQRAPTTAEWDAAMARVMQDRAPLADKTGGGE